jgi:hypothetical protein
MMAGCSIWEYHKVTPKVFQSLQVLAKQQGYHIPNTPSGVFNIQAVGMTITFHYKWNKSKEMLRLKCLKKPLVSCALIKGMADKIVHQSGGQ